MKGNKWVKGNDKQTCNLLPLIETDPYLLQQLESTNHALMMRYLCSHNHQLRLNSIKASET